MQPERIRGWHDRLIVGYIGISQLEKGFEDFIGDVFTLSLNEFNVSIFLWLYLSKTLTTMWQHVPSIHVKSLAISYFYQNAQEKKYSLIQGHMFWIAIPKLQEYHSY